MPGGANDALPNSQLLGVAGGVVNVVVHSEREWGGRYLFEIDDPNSAYGLPTSGLASPKRALGSAFCRLQNHHPNSAPKARGGPDENVWPAEERSKKMKNRFNQV